MTIMFTRPYDDDDDTYGDRREQPPRPFTVPHLFPAPLSDDVEEIFAYMLLIGDRADHPRR